MAICSPPTKEGGPHAVKVSPLCYVSCLACLIASASIRAAAWAGVSPSRSSPWTASALRLSRIRSPSGSASGAARRASAALTKYRVTLTPALAAAALSASACSGVTRTVRVTCFAKYRADALRCASVVLMFSPPYIVYIIRRIYAIIHLAHMIAHIFVHIAYCICYHIRAII